MNIWCLLVYYGSTIVLKVIKHDFFLACCSWRRSANTRCWWLGRNFWLHFRHGQHGLNHIANCSCGKRTESSKDEKQENNTKWNLLHQKSKYTETYTVWCCWIRNEKTNSTLRLVLVCTSGIGLVKLPPLFTDRMKELNWTLAPSQCWLCRRLSGDALRQNLFSTWSILQKHLFDALKSQIHQHTIYIYLRQSGWVYAIINQNRVDMSEHEWTHPTSSLDSKANQASCAAAWLPSESATKRKKQWKTLRMQKSTYKQHWVFSCMDIWTFDVFWYTMGPQ